MENVKNLTQEQIKKINEVWESISHKNSKNETLENQIEDIWQYYDCAGFSIQSDEDFCKLLKI